MRGRRLPEWVLRTAICGLAGICGSALGQQYIVRNLQLVQEQLSANSRAADTTLMLTESQSAPFWRIYDRYHLELGGLRERFAAVLEKYAAEDSAGMTNARAAQLLDEAIALEDAEVALRKDTAAQLEAVLPGIEHASYLETDDSIRVAVKLELVEVAPVE